MNTPLLLSRLIDHAGVHHARTEVVSRRIDGTVERSNWALMRERSRRLAKALTHLGLRVDDVVGSLAWNTSNYIELFYGTLGIGVALHTCNPRITPEDLRYMIEKVGQTTMFVDADTLPLAEKVAAITPQVTRWVMMDEEGAELPHSSLPGYIAKSELVAGHDADFEWPVFDENQAATICFTSGTTGRPKGVAYSHRSLTLGAMNMSMADMFGQFRSGALEVVMPVAAIFHANGWMMPFTAPMNGHKLVLNGRDFSPASLIELIDAEGVTMTGAVPTIWMDLLTAADRAGSRLESVRTGLVAGTRPSQALIGRFEELGITLCQSWGMTEVPGCTRSTPPPGSEYWPADDRLAHLVSRQGRVGSLTEMRLVDDDGHAVAMNGKQSGHLQLRGPIVAGSYVGQEGGQAEWLDTGDIALIFEDGSLEIVDRAKDVIKSGGEWISSPQVENAAASYPAIAEAAVISVPHPRWQERPLLLCTLRDPDAELDLTALYDHMAQSIAKWWLPDATQVIEAMPRTTTGKIDKVSLRREYANRVGNIIT